MIPPIERILDEHRTLDLVAPKGLQIEIDASRGVVYVHTEGVTLLRASKVEDVTIVRTDKDVQTDLLTMKW